MKSNTYMSTDDFTRSSILKVQGCDLGQTGVNKGTTLPLAASYCGFFTHAQGSDTSHVAASFLLSLQIKTENLGKKENHYEEETEKLRQSHS